MKACSQCGGPLPPPKVGGQRKYCLACSPPRPDRANAKVTVLKARERVYESTLQTLTEAGLRDSWRGAMLLVLAERIDSGDDSGAGLAALVRAFRDLFTRTLEGHQSEPSPLDELRRRRERKSR